jgi:K+/H+ antiporter YhaU regulatory subunit KhtT
VAPPVLVNRTLAAADLRRRFGVTVIAVRRRRAEGDIPTEVLVSPPADLEIGPNDLIMVAGSHDALLRLQRAGQR